MSELGLWVGLTLWLEPGPFNNRTLKKSLINIRAKKIRPKYVNFMGRVGCPAHVQVYSRHVIGDKSKFLSFTPIEGGHVTFGDNSNGKVIGKGRIGKSPNLYTDNVLFVKGLKHNLLSISQFCDKGSKVTFDSNYCIVEN